jgi:hypothetical protein
MTRQTSRTLPTRLMALATAVLLAPAALGPTLQPRLEISCRPLEEADGRGTPFGDMCAPGEQVFLGIHTTQGHRYFAAFAVSHVNAAHWFFPSNEEEQSVDAQPELGFHWLATETPVDELPGSGEHRVLAFFSKAPLDREKIRSLMMGEGSPGIIVIEKKLLLLEG